MKCKIIHLSDLHIGRVEGKFAKIRSFFGRSTDHNLVATEKIVRHITRNHDPSESIVVITGDITEHGRQKEYEAAYEALRPLVDEGFDVHVVPGNHDVGRSGLVFQKQALQNFRQFSKEISGQDTFPYTKKYESFNLLCTDSTCRSKHPAKMARGEMGSRQIAYLASVSTSKPVVVALHHSPLGGNPALKLKDKEDFLAATNDDQMICLYGHLHQSEHFYRTDDHCEMIASPKMVDSMSYRVINMPSRGVEVCHVR